MSLLLEKETLRNLSGSALTLRTHLEPMNSPALNEINGGGPVSEAVSHVLSGVASFLTSAAVSVLDSLPSDEAASAIVGGAASIAASGDLSDAVSEALGQISEWTAGFFG